MAKRIGTISIGVNLGTAKFIADADATNAKIRQFTQQSRNSMVATTTVVREMNGHILNSNRAVARFLSDTLGLGPAMQAIFPLAGGIAFGAMAVDLGVKVGEFFKKMQEAPARVATAFRELNAPLKATNDQLVLTNARLDEDIAKLEGRRQNTLRSALADAVVEADKLADSLDKDLEKLNKLLKDESHNKFMQALFGAPGAGNDLAEFFGNRRDDIAAINAAAEARMRTAKTPAESKAAEVERNVKLLEQQRQINAYLDQQEEKYEALSRTRTKFVRNEMGGGIEVAIPGKNVAADLAIIDRARAYAKDMAALVPLTTEEGAKKAKKGGLEAARENEGLDRPFADRMKALTAQLEGVKQKMGAAGLSEAAKAMAKGFGESLKAIEEVNKALEKHHIRLTDAQMGQITLKEIQIATMEAEAEWKVKLASATAQLIDQTKAQELLTVAIGNGYEATRRASVEAKLMQTVGGEKYNDPAWMKSHQGDVSGLRSQIGAEFEAKHGAQIAQVIDQLNDEIHLELELAQVQLQGSEAVRQATMEVKYAKQLEDGATQEQIDAERKLYQARKDNSAAESISKINERLAGIKAISAAQIEGAEAVRKADLETRYREMARMGDKPEVIAATRQADEAEHSQKVAEQALKAANAYKDQLASLDAQVAALNQIKADGKDNLGIEIALRDLQNERLKAAVQQSLAMKTAKDGVRAFFLEMQESAKSTAEIIYETLNSAVDRVSENLSKVFTGQKADFAKMFQDIGGQMFQSSTKALIQKGLGAIGAAFGIKMPAGKPDGTQSNPLWVQWAGAAPAGAAAGDGPGRIFGGAAGGGIFNLLGSFLGLEPHAGGGGVSPGQAYLVGEQGPEILMGASGRIASNSESRRLVGGGGDTYHMYNVDARGADIGAEQRLYRALDVTHKSAVATSIQMSAERAKRMPTGTHS